jgi:thiamine-phosphate pyrophosphorylase
MRTGCTSARTTCRRRRCASCSLSTHSEEQLAASAGEPVDYVSAGQIWETPTKQGRPAVGLDYIRHAAKSASRPFFAIGGIDPSNAARAVEAGAQRICVVRALRDAANPTAVAEELRGALAPLGEAAPGG